MGLNSNKRRLGVIGVGTAGIVSIAHLIPWLTNDWEIVSIYDPETPILGIGESTNPNIILTLCQGLGFVEANDLEELDGTLKFGTKYINWRDAEWVNPLFGGGHAIHFNNFKLKEFAFRRLKELWPKKFKVLEGKIESLVEGFQCVNLRLNGNVEKFDYIIDCRGFPENYDNYHISNCSPVNKCFVHSKPPHNTDKFPCTDHIATKNGWMFGIPLTTRHTYGYLFNEDITTDDEAICDMEEILDVKLNKETITTYKFKSYYAKQIFNGRILKNGNRALFFEPLSANSIFCYIAIAEMFAHYLENPMKYNVDFVNTEFYQLSASLEDMLSFLYHGGTLYDTAFWKYAKDKAITRLNNSKMFAGAVAEYRKFEKLGIPLYGKTWFFTPHSLRVVDKAMNYNYFKEK